MTVRQQDSIVRRSKVCFVEGDGGAASGPSTCANVCSTNALVTCESEQVDGCGKAGGLGGMVNNQDQGKVPRETYPRFCRSQNLDKSRRDAQDRDSFLAMPWIGLVLDAFQALCMTLEIDLPVGREGTCR